MRVFNLGEDCESVWRMHTLGVHMEGPFNDKGIPMSSLLYLLTTSMFDMFKIENLKVLDPLPPYTYYRERYFRVVDTATKGETFHTFPNDKPLVASYVPFRQKLESQITDFTTTLKNDNGELLFIHKKTDIETICDMEDIKNQYRSLLDIITMLRLGKPYSLVAVGLNDVFDEDWNMTNLKTYRIHSPKLWGNTPIEKTWYKIAAMVKPRITYL